MKIFVTGSNGTVGSYFMKEVSKEHEVIAPSSKHFDVTNENHWRISMAHYKPDVIVHLAAMTNVDKCEKEPYRAMRSNTLPSVHMAQHAPSHCSIIYMSASSVFGENGKMMPEEDEECFAPVAQYSSSKLYGEMILRSAVMNRKFKNLIVVRAGWIYGGAGGNKFIKKILGKLQRSETFYTVGDLKGNPVYAKDLAEFLSLCVDRAKMSLGKKYNVLHFACDDDASRTDMAAYLGNLIRSRSKIIDTKNEKFKLPAKRPSSELLGAHKTQKMMGVKFRPWRDALKDYYNNELKD